MPSFENVTEEQIEKFTKYLGERLELIVEAFRVYDFLSGISKKEMSFTEKWDRGVKLVDEATKLAEDFDIPEENRREFSKRHIRNEKFYGLPIFPYNSIPSIKYD